jgi:hypothetical protein
LRKKLLALRQVVQVDFQRKRIFFMRDTSEIRKAQQNICRNAYGAREERD